MRGVDVLKLIVSIVICQLAGVIGSVFTAESVSTWYVTLSKPAFTPPSWLFAPVWISLYGLMGIALFLVWRKAGQAADVGTAMALFIIQLVLNASWSAAFFGARSPLAGLIVILLLTAAIVLTIVCFWRVSVPAGVLLVPYLAWVAFAAVLNASIYALNR